MSECKKQVKKLAGTRVLQQSDLLSEICSYLSIIDIFGSVSPLCQFYYQFINNPQQLKLIKKCINCQRGENDGLTIISIMEKIGIKLIYDKQNHPFGLSLSEQVNMIIDYWKKWDKYLITDAHTNEDHQMNNAKESKENDKETDLSHHLSQLRKQVEDIDHPFACRGSIPITDDKPSRLIIFDKSNSTNTSANMCQKPSSSNSVHVSKPQCFEINCNVFDDYEIEQLKSFMKPASFGYKNQTKYDPTYRNSLQLSNESFSFIFGDKKQEFEMLNKIQKMLLPDSDYNIYHELYKLNLMSKGGFFKQHVDTPHGNNFIGTLVLCVPVSLFKGGNLMIWKLNKQQKRLKCDFSQNVNDDESDDKVLEWCAFYGDCGHEVLPVTDGNRVTVTFNLYYNKFKANKKSDKSVLVNQYYQSTSIDKSIINFEKYLYVTLCNCDFLPNGGRIGFGCEYQYPVETLNDVSHREHNTCTSIYMCKGIDAVIWLLIKQRFSFLEHNIVPIVEENDYYKAMFEVNSFPELSRPDPNGLKECQVSDYFDLRETVPVHIEETEIDVESGIGLRSSKDQIHWLSFSSAKQANQAALCYGNDYSVEFYYVSAAIVIEIPPFKERIKLLQK